MKKNNYLFLIFLLITIVSCHEPQISKPQNIMVATVSSNNCTKVDNFLTFENDTISVVYVFWAENGSMGMLIHNKLEKPIYIDWRKCSYIIGQTKNDYWKETLEIKSIGSASETSNMVNNTNISTWRNFSKFDMFQKDLLHSQTHSYGSSFFNSITVLTKPERITFIPPSTTISMSNFPLVENNIFNINESDYINKDTTAYLKGYYKEMGDNIIHYVDSLTVQKVKLNYIEYGSETTPFNFRSFLTYSTEENFSRESYINNSFYLSSITRVPNNIFNGAKKNNDGLYLINLWASPNSFYLFE